MIIWNIIVRDKGGQDDWYNIRRFILFSSNSIICEVGKQSRDKNRSQGDEIAMTINYYYFIAFEILEENSTTKCNSSVKRNTKIRTNEDIEDLLMMLGEQFNVGVDKIYLVNYKFMRVEMED